MDNTSAANTSSENASESASVTVFSRAEGIAWCIAFILESLFIVVGNLLTIVLFAVNKTLRKRSLFLVINMAFADLMLGALSIPDMVYRYGEDVFRLWRGGAMSKPLDNFFMIVDYASTLATLLFAALISMERLYAIYWPFKHRILSLRAYCVVNFVAWTLAFLDSGLSYLISEEHSDTAWISYSLTLVFILCFSNIAIWRKFQQGRVASQQQNRALRNKRLTKTLLFVSVLVLLSWLPFLIVHALYLFFDVRVPRRYFIITNFLNYSSSFFKSSCVCIKNS